MERAYFSYSWSKRLNKKRNEVWYFFKKNEVRLNYYMSTYHNIFSVFKIFKYIHSNIDVKKFQQ